MFIPNEDYIFRKNSGRQFRYLWLKEFSWLRYSKSTDGAFCLSCVLFGNKFKLRSRKLTHLYLEPFNKWSDAIRSFSNHESTKNGSHLNNCSKNASYISKTSQNEIIKCCGEEISESIPSEVRKNVFFSIIADEACDSSTEEQMSLVLRFFDSDFNIKEDFIQFIHCSEGVKGKDLFNVLSNCVSNLNLDIKNCRGQEYDGASFVSGYINENRQKFLEASILEQEPQTHKKKVKDICRTRWIERIDGLNTFLEHYLSIFQALCNMAFPESSVNKDTQNKSSTFLNSIGTFQFVFTLVVTTRVFDFTLRVTWLLQSKTIDILDGLHLITVLKNTFISVRNNIDSFHNNCYEAACLLSSKAEIFVSKPRTCSIQKNRSNVPSESVSEYFKRAVTIPFIDHVSTYIYLQDLNQKLPKTQLCWRKQFETFYDFYIDDFPNISALNGELVLWEKYWESFSGTIPDNISLTLKSISFPGFENIKIALRILGTLPVTSCECERSFSVMRHLKDYMRTTMSDDRLNGLALMYIHQEIVSCIDNVINRFTIKNRRLDFND
nr:52 kDa repressor of the inhibitor of the protein kinase-like [Hydra vulgaris]